MNRGATLLLGLCLWGAACASRGQTSESHSFSELNRSIPDGNVSGLSDRRTVSSAINNLASVRVRLRIAGEFNGDLYGYVRHVGGGVTNLCVLLNRAGRTAADPWGYADFGVDVTFDDAASADIHGYRSLGTPSTGAPLAGTWQPDGRKVGPDQVLDTTARATSLSAFAGGGGSGEWTLYLVDFSGGGTNMLVSWGLDFVSAPPVSVAGTVSYYGSLLPVAGVGVSVNGDPSLTAQSAADGTYVITNLPSGGTFRTAPIKTNDTPALAGVTSLDLALTQRHIVGKALLNSPYKMLAADANGSGNLTSLDLALVQRLIVGKASQVPAGVWRFVPVDYVFANPQSPWSGPTNSWHTNLTANGVANFIAIKTGDVNNSWLPTAAAKASVPIRRLDANPPTVTFQVASARATAGQRVSVEVTGSGFKNVTSAQFTLCWDPSALRHVGVEGNGLPGLSAGSFGDTLTDNGRLAFSWFDPDSLGVTLADGATLFRLSFEVLGPTGSSTTLVLNDSVATREVSVNFEPAQFHSLPGVITVAPADLRLTQPRQKGGSFEFSFATETGRNYVLEYSDTLAPANWVASDRIAGDGTQRTVTDHTATNHQRFYRVRAE